MLPSRHLTALIGLIALPSFAQTLPTHVPPKRSSQIRSGFGINSDLPREPYLPWNRWWWTRMFDAGVSLDTHRAVREQFGSNELGLGGT
jgi:hypothetical protein